MRPSRQDVFSEIKEHRFIPLFNHDDLNVSKQVLKAAYDGGVRVFEYTHRSPNAFSVFKELVKYANQSFADMVLGAGTILTAVDAKAYYDGGADFIVSPTIPLEVATWCEENSVFWCPGASTLNEIMLAKSLGADMVKIFPANYLGGPGYLKALKGPCPNIDVLITGGVEPNKENLSSWFEAGAMAVGMGSNLFNKESIGRNDFEGIRKMSADIVGIIRGIAKA